MSEEREGRDGDVPEKESRCPKCGGEMDRGKVNSSSPYGTFFYSSDQHKAHFIDRSGFVAIASARACYRCGYLEMYLNTEQFQKHLER